MLGMALDFILKNSFRQDAGLRPRARKIGVLITDGKSQDDVVTPSRRLRDEGVELYAIGKYYMMRWPMPAPSYSSAQGSDNIHKYLKGYSKHVFRNLSSWLCVSWLSFLSSFVFMSSL